MDKETTHPTSFSAGRRWGLFFSVIISIVAVFALVVMVNYLGARYYKRLYWSRQADQQLSLRTMALLKSVTNQVNVIIYFDKGNDLYDSVASVLNEYRLTNPKISVRTVDYLFNASEAQQVKATYKLGAGEDKNVVIFECNGRQKVILESELGEYSYAAEPGDTERNYSKHLKATLGERQFSSALMNVTSIKQRKAYFVEGNGEHSLESTSRDGYQHFGMLLEENSIVPGVIRLIGTNTIPADCNLLVIAGPRRTLPPEELKKIKDYLDQGGRLLVLFNFETQKIVTGLEDILEAWNVKVGMNVVSDPPNTATGNALEVIYFNLTHLVSRNLNGSMLLMANPRSVEALKMTKSGPESFKVTSLFYTAPTGVIDHFAVGNPVSLAAAVEKQSIQGVVSENGSTAIVVVGDSLMLANEMIDLPCANRDFAALAINWLVDERQLMEGIGPHPVKEYKLMMTEGQLKSVDWIFLGAMPGAALVMGGLVWFRRRR
jgi:ABC-type uncharacterized transport system